jgi:hypothetical protein
MVIKMNYKENTAKTTLKKNLMKLDKRQLKLFFSIIVHYWLTNKSFISKMNFFHMWCKLNDHCCMVDASFPDPHIDHKLTTAYCQAHPFYFIDMLEPELVINLFCEYLDTRIDILTMVVNKLITGGIKAAYEYSNKVLDFGEDVDKLVIETEAYVSCLS